MVTIAKFPYKLWDNLGFDRHFKSFLNTFIKDVGTDINEQKSRVDELIRSNSQPEEIVDLRTDDEGEIHPVARDRFQSDHNKFRKRFEDNEKNLGVMSKLGTRIRTVVENILDQGINVNNFNVHADGIGDDTETFSLIFSQLKDGDKIIIPYGHKYLLTGDALEISANNILITGGGTLISERGIRIKGNGFTVDGVKHESYIYRINTAMYFTDATPSEPIKDITIRNCTFENFFYSTNFRSTGGVGVENIKIDHCKSTAPPGRNAGHFQHVRVRNASNTNNSTYGGQNCTSYNFFESVGVIRVIGNFDEGNSYGSCEIENASGSAVVSGNTFFSRIWIDDSVDVVVNGNFVDDGIRTSVGSNKGDSENIIVSNNICRTITAISFGEYKGGEITNLIITGNRLRGGGSSGINVNGNVTNNVLIEHNSIGAGYTTSKIGIIRGAGLTAVIRSNFVNGVILMSSAGGTVYSTDNVGAQHNGTRDQLSGSYLEKAMTGVTLVSENGTKYRLYTNNSGELQTQRYT